MRLSLPVCCATVVAALLLAFAGTPVLAEDNSPQVSPSESITAFYRARATEAMDRHAAPLVVSDELITRELWERGMSAPAGARTLARSLLTYSWEHADRKSRSGRDHDSTHHCDALRYWCINRRWGPTSKAPPGLAFGLGIGRDSAGLPSN